MSAGRFRRQVNSTSFDAGPHDVPVESLAVEVVDVVDEQVEPCSVTAGPLLVEGVSVVEWTDWGDM